MSSTVGNIMFMRWQFVITHMILHTEFYALLDSWVTNTPSVKMLCLQKIAGHIFQKSMTCLSVGLLRISYVASVFCTIVYWWIMTNCCFMSDKLRRAHFPLVMCTP